MGSAWTTQQAQKWLSENGFLRHDSSRPRQWEEYRRGENIVQIRVSGQSGSPQRFEFSSQAGKKLSGYLSQLPKVLGELA